MSIQTNHTHRGFSIRIDELEPFGSLTMNKATHAALEQLENGSEDVLAERYQVKAKTKFASHEQHELESTHGTKDEAEARARTLKDAGYDTEIVEPTSAGEPPKSYGRYRVHTQVRASAPFMQTHTFADEGEAQEQAAKLDGQGVNTQIIDSNNGAVVQKVYPDGTAVVPDADETIDGPVDAQHGATQYPDSTVATGIGVTPSAPYGDSEVRDLDPVALPVNAENPATEPETPEHQFLRHEQEAKQ